MLTALNQRYQLLLSVLDAEPEVEITYFVPDERKSGGAYRTVSGVVKKADEFVRRLTLTDGTVIPMEDVLMLDGAYLDRMNKKIHALHKRRAWIFV